MTKEHPIDYRFKEKKKGRIQSYLSSLESQLRTLFFFLNNQKQSVLCIKGLWSQLDLQTVQILISEYLLD